MTICSFLLLIIPVTTASAQKKSITLKTYYPEPIAAFDRIRLIPQTTAPTDPCDVGELTLYKDAAAASGTGDSIYLCVPDAAQGRWILLSGPWTSDTTAAEYNVYPKDFANANLKIGVGTEAPDFKLTLEGGGSILAKGVKDEGTALPSGEQSLGQGVRMIWYPKGGGDFFAGGLGPGEGVISGTWDLNLYAATVTMNWEEASPENLWDGDSNNTSSPGLALGYNVSPGISRGSVVLGRNNYIRGNEFACGIGGGRNNLIDSGSVYGATVIGGGEGNRVCSGIKHFIGGGQMNVIGDGGYSVIGGGEDNFVTASNSCIMGGRANSISHIPLLFSSILGGEENKIFAESTTELYSILIGGGYQNSTFGANQYNLIPGGSNNAIFSAEYSSIMGGTHNTIAKQGSVIPNYSMIGGGTGNTTYQPFSTIIGGNGNTINYENEDDGWNDWSMYSIIVGGAFNSTTAGLSFIGGGLWNRLRSHTDSDYNGVIAGGNRNLCSAGCMIGGGQDNAVGPVATVRSNFDTASQSAVGDNSVIMGGKSNTASSEDSWVGGHNMTLTADHSFLWGHDNTTPVTSTGSDFSFIIRTGKVGVQTVSPQYALDVAGGMRVTGKMYLTNLPTAASGTTGVVSDAGGNIGQDLAEAFPFADDQSVSPGDVMTLDEDNPAGITLSHTPYDPKVVGVISTAPAITLEGQRVIMGQYPKEDDSKGRKSAVALRGRVRVKVTLENGPIAVGDPLTTSSVKGCAMKATDAERSFGATIGKAMEPFTGGPDGEAEGVIIAFVTLH